MKALREAIHKALRDDSAATVGLRALLGHATTPFGVYYHFFPETPDFTNLSYLTYYFLAGVAGESHDVDAYLREHVFAVTAWSEDMDKMEDILMRVRNVIENMRKLTLPTATIGLHSIKWESASADLFDQDDQVYHRTEQYRAFYREDITN